MNVRIVELSEPIKGTDRFIIETKTKDKIISILWGLFYKAKTDWEIASGTQIPVSFANYEDAQVAAKRWYAIINPTYHYL